MCVHSYLLLTVKVGVRKFSSLNNAYYFEWKCCDDQSFPFFSSLGIVVINVMTWNILQRQTDFTNKLLSTPTFSIGSAHFFTLCIQSKHVCECDSFGLFCITKYFTVCQRRRRRRYSYLFYSAVCMRSKHTKPTNEKKRGISIFFPSCNIY